MEPENRFAHLLRPIRDLSENWNIDIAKYLEDYIQEIEGITVSFDNGANIMNFAEAALVIQGSACVYSKKVEYLYKLVYQTLNMISSRKKEGAASSVDAQGRDADVSAALGQSDNGQQFLTLDDIKESNNIDMVEYAGKEHNISLLPRTPLALIPLQDAEKHGSALKSRTGELLGSKQDYKMNTSSIHSSGALLLEPINRIYPDGKPALSGQRLPIPPLQLDTSAAMVARDAMEMDDDGPDMDMGGGYYSDNNDNTTPKSIRRSNRKGGIRMLQDDTNILQEDEPLLLLDPHQASNTPNRPFQKGNTVRMPASLQGKGKKNNKMKKTAQLEPLAEFLLRTFYSCCMQFPRQLVKKPLFPEFETQYWQHQQHVKDIRKKEAQKLKSLQKESFAAQLQNAVEGVGLEEEEEGHGEPCIPLGDIPDYDDDNAGADGYYDNIDEERIDEAIGSHDPATGFQNQSQIGDNLNIVQSYEDIVRNYVEKTLESAMTYAIETELSLRVQQWERRIRPILEKEELRPPFDIHRYGGEILNEFERHEIAEDDRMSFKTIAEDKDENEVCRMFLASLQLANNYNVKIDETDEVQVMWMKLLSRQLPHEAMEEFRAPSLQTAHSTLKNK